MTSLTYTSRAFRTSIALVLVLGPSIGRGQPARTPDVHFVPTPMQVVDGMLAVARVTKSDRLYDLGSGDGRIVIAAAKRFGTRGIGIDIDPQRIKESRRNADTAGVSRLVEFREADLFQTDLRDASVVTLYLLPRLNVKLRPKLFAELRPGSRVVSHAFDMGDWPADSTLVLDRGTVYYWLMPARVEGTWTVTAPTGPSGRTYELRFTQNYQRLTGTAASGGRGYYVDSARLVGDSVMFLLNDTTTTASSQSERRLRFAGRVTGGTISGAMTGDGGTTGQWRATRTARE